MGLRDRLRKRAKHDAEGIRQMLEGSGASPDEADRIVQLLGARLTPAEMHVWLSDPDRSHPVPDPEFARTFQDAGLAPVPMDWTAVNAISAGKTHLVVDEAERFAARG